MKRVERGVLVMLVLLGVFIAGVQMEKYHARREGNTYDVGYEAGYNDAGEAPRDDDAIGMKLEIENGGLK